MIHTKKERVQKSYIYIQRKGCNSHIDAGTRRWTVEDLNDHKERNEHRGRQRNMGNIEQSSRFQQGDKKTDKADRS